jgi:hypothetical protein
MKSFKIIITPIICRQDGMTDFEDVFDLEDIFEIRVVDGQIKLYSLCDSLTFWGSAFELKKRETSTGRVYESEDHWKPLPEGSSTNLEFNGEFCQFKYKRDTRFNKPVEFTALVRRN